MHIRVFNPFNTQTNNVLNKVCIIQLVNLLSQNSGSKRRDKYNSNYTHDIVEGFV